MQMHTSYLKCPVHPAELLQLICMTCQSNSLACPLCLDAQHNMHQVISLKKFMNQQIPKLYENNIQPNHENLMKDMEKLGDLFKQFIQKLRKQIGYEINQLQKFFLEREDRIKEELQFVNGQYHIKNIYQNAEAAKLLINSKAKIPSPETFQAKIKQISHKMGESINDACIQIRRIIFKVKSIFTDSLSLLLNSKKISSFQFSQGHCHSQIQLKNNKKLAVNKNFDNIYHTCMVLPALTPFKNQITFEIKKSQHKCIWIGIADIDVLKQMKYENTYKSEGAHYWIWQAGGGGEQAQLYSQNSENHPLIGWNFDEGDRIRLILQYKENDKKQLHFIKNKQEEQKFTIIINQKIGAYYACVSLGDEGESISIINEDDI